MTYAPEARAPREGSPVFLASVRAALRAMIRYEVEGLEHVPASGPCLVVFNQLSLLDTPLLRVAIPRRDVAGLVAMAYSRNPFHRFMIERGGGIWLERGVGDRVGLEAALAALRRGWIVGISPEGRRSRSGGLERGKPGVAALALRAGVPVVPLAITNMDRVAGNLRRLRRTEVSLEFGRPVPIPRTRGGDRSGLRREAVDRIMCHLAALLPPRYRGVYAEHPELAPLLESKETGGTP